MTEEQGTPAIVDNEKVNILIVDDRWENLVSLKAVLDLPGYNLVKASSGREALKRLLEHDFALILLDVQMPILNGFETATLIKKRERTAHIPIIFVTGMNIDEPFVFKGYDVGAVDYIIKPFDPVILRSKVAVFAELFRKTRELKTQSERLLASERQRLELEAARRVTASNERYRELVDGLRDVIVWSADVRARRIDFVSPQVERILGNTPVDLVTKDITSFAERVPAEDLGKFEAALVRAHTERRDVMVEHRVFGANGAVRWFQTSVWTSVADAPQIHGLSVDVTHLKGVEEALRSSEDRLRFVAEAGRVAFEPLEAEARLKAISQISTPWFADFCFFDIRDEKSQLIRVASSHVTNEGSALLERLHGPLPGVADRLLPAERVDRSGSPLFVQKFEASCFESMPEGTHQDTWRRLAPCSMLTVPLLSRGEPLGVMTFGMSISRREFQLADFEVAQEVARRAALAIDNARLFEKAQKAINLRDEFLSIASHELRTPLTPLKLHLQLLRRFSNGAQLPPELNRHLGNALTSSDRQVNRMVKLVDELLDVTRINSGKLVLEPEELDLAELVEDVCMRFAEDITKTGCSLKIIPASKVRGSWDRLRIEQIVINLLTNALKYARGAAIEIETSLADGGGALLRVSDRGPGIPSADQERIFKCFERASNSDHASGLGLGLYIVSQIVRAHGGKIEVNSRLGEGTTFRVRLPATIAAAQSEAG